MTAWVYCSCRKCPLVCGFLTFSIQKVAVTRFAESRDVDLRQSYFYADGDEDVALMRVIGHPRPVNPRAGLAAEALRMGWPVLRVGVGQGRRGSMRTRLWNRPTNTGG
jgi:phosphoserine phosphatase